MDTMKKVYLEKRDDDNLSYKTEMGCFTMNLNDTDFQSVNSVMEEDLGLFLNNNTTAFTNWLHAVLEKLKKVTLEEVTKKEVKKKKIKKVSEKPVKKAKDAKEKSGKDAGRVEREDRRRREGKEKAERASGRAKSKERKSI